jgi:hypothetical protein
MRYPKIRIYPGLFTDNQLLSHVITLLSVGLEPGIQEIGEKEKFQDNEDDEKFNQDNNP